MTGWKLNSYIALILRIYIAGVFIYASFHKIIYPELFALDIASYDILPVELINLMAIVLPWLELFVGIMVFTGFQVKSNILLMIGMMIMFMTALSIALYNGLDMACGCFASSEAEEAISYKTLLRDFIWISICIYIFVFDNKPIGIDSMILNKKRTGDTNV